MKKNKAQRTPCKINPKKIIPACYTQNVKSKTKTEFWKQQEKNDLLHTR